MPQPAFGRRSTPYETPVNVRDLGWYWRSPWWMKVREQAMVARGRRCQNCGGQAVTVRHRHYRTVGFETLQDLDVLCKRCSKGGR